MKNAIFQYMVVNPNVDARGDIGPHNGMPKMKRSDLYNQVADISKRSFEIYAQKIGADHFYSDEQVTTACTNDSTALLYECLRVIYDPMFDQYDNVLFLDTDIVCNTEENIFDLMEGDVMGVLETDIRTPQGGGYGGWDGNDDRARSVYESYVRKFSYHGVPIVPALPPDNRASKITIMNTGVVCWSKEARLRAREVFDDWYEWFTTGPQEHMSVMNDQPYLSAQWVKHDFDIQTIDQKWNDSPHYPNEDTFFEVANFCHYTGGEWKLDMLRHYQENKFKIFSK